MKFSYILLFFSIILISCGNTKVAIDSSKPAKKPQKKEIKKEKPNTITQKQISKKLIPKDTTLLLSAQRTDLYLHRLQGKNVAVIANKASTVNGQHLVDFLLSNDINIVKIFSPEHGFRGTADAGEVVKNGIDKKTNLPIISLYGKNKKPYKKQLQNIDIIVFDLQDVGVRFYTYISTLHYIMEASAENNIEIILLDRPNPNAHYIDGSILQKSYKSFVGMHPVPVVYGMTIGEYAQMINGENWLKNGIKCNLEVIPMKNYTHSTRYNLPIKPSPNLPNSKSINLYPSLCFFEGTNVSVGRGTASQFQIYGSPFLKKTNFSFVPKPNFGAKHPKHKFRKCYGENLSFTKYQNKLNLEWLLGAYKSSSVKSKFFNNFFNKLAGNGTLKKQIISGKSQKEIRKSWQKGLEAFKITRQKYLLYN